jgi:hypothetical protein
MKWRPPLIFNLVAIKLGYGEEEGVKWSAHRDLNPDNPVPNRMCNQVTLWTDEMVAGAAFASAAFGYEPNELRHTLPGNEVVGMVGFGPTTRGFSDRCSTN